jgi:hypothetical protein
MRKHPVLLLELVISLVLFGAIMTILFSSYKELSQAKHSLKKDKEIILTRQKLQLRMSQIFSQTETLTFEDQVCLLTYDNGWDPAAAFRGKREAMLYIDKGRLALVTWPEKGPGRKEILYEPAHSFFFQFFDTKKGEWNPQYPEQKPFMMKMIIDKNLTLPFFL